MVQILNGNNYINDAIKNGAKIVVSNLKFEGFNNHKIYLLGTMTQENYYQRQQVIFIIRSPKILLQLPEQMEKLQ